MKLLYYTPHEIYLKNAKDFKLYQKLVCLVSFARPTNTNRTIPFFKIIQLNN